MDDVLLSYWDNFLWNVSAWTQRTANPSQQTITSSNQVILVKEPLPPSWKRWSSRCCVDRQVMVGGHVSRLKNIRMLIKRCKAQAIPSKQWKTSRNCQVGISDMFNSLTDGHLRPSTNAFRNKSSSMCMLVQEITYCGHIAYMLAAHLLILKIETEA